MGLLEKFEDSLDKMVSGAFARAFKAEVQPVEIASAIQREIDDRAAVMDRNRTVVPNVFAIELSHHDYTRLAVFKDALCTELATLVRDYAGEQRYTLLGTVTVTLGEDDILDTGIFRVRSEARAEVTYSTGTEFIADGGATVGQVLTCDSIEVTSEMESHMRISRALTLTAATAAAALTLSAVPAQAASLSPATVADAYSVMLTPGQAQLVGIGKQNLSDFGVAHSAKGTPNAPWLCDLTGTVEVEGNGAKTLLTSEVFDLNSKDVSSLFQEIHWYSSEKQAKKAYDDLVTKIKRCEGDHSPTNDLDADVTYTIETNLTNGTKKAKDGDPFLWVRSETTLSDPTTNYAGHEYTTVRQIGKYIQLLDLKSEGVEAKPLTQKQIAAADRLTDSLGDAWRAKFM